VYSSVCVAEQNGRAVAATIPKFPQIIMILKIYRCFHIRSQGIRTWCVDVGAIRIVNSAVLASRHAFNFEHDNVISGSGNSTITLALEACNK
jgi:hypothetical protein